MVRTVASAEFWMSVTAHSVPSQGAPLPNVTSTSSDDVTSGKLAQVTVVDTPSSAEVVPKMVAEFGVAAAVGGAKYSKSKAEVWAPSAEEMEPVTRPVTEEAATSTMATTVDATPCSNEELTSETVAATSLIMTVTSSGSCTSKLARPQPWPVIVMSCPPSVLPSTGESSAAGSSRTMLKVSTSWALPSASTVDTAPLKVPAVSCAGSIPVQTSMPF
mmetsp:Transcript_59086/g.139106  ORF Transcript_59086/g.139106 Transcript_59086/m.139106 type:complete len:217 (-) Transcript_59086:7333-7983(-)